MSLYREVIRFEATCSTLRLILRHALAPGTPFGPAQDACVRAVLVALHDAWAVRCRAIVLRSALGGIVTRSGARLKRTPQLLRHESPLTALRRLWTRKKQKLMPKRWEPRWHDAGQATDAARILEIANENEIAFGLGASVAPEHLRAVRNAIAHTVPDVWPAFRRVERDLGTMRHGDPVDLSLARLGGTGVRHVDHWMAELAACLHAAVE